MSLLKWFTITALGLCSLGLSASEQLNVFNPTSFVAGMLLIYCEIKITTVSDNAMKLILIMVKSLNIMI